MLASMTMEDLSREAVAGVGFTLTTCQQGIEFETSHGSR